MSKSINIWTRPELKYGQLTLTEIQNVSTKKQARIAARKHNVFCEGDENGNINTLREMLESLDSTPYAQDIGSNSRVWYNAREQTYQIVNSMGGIVFEGDYEETANRIILE